MFTSSPLKRNSFGRRTAWLLPFWKIFAVAMIDTSIYHAAEAIGDEATAHLFSYCHERAQRCTGTPVFEGRLVEVIQSHLQRAPQAPSARLGRPVPAKLERVVLDCLEKDPDRRPESAKALADRLEACDDVEPWLPDQAQRWWRARKTA